MEFYYLTERMYIPNDLELKQVILEKAHESDFTIHHGYSKMYHVLKRSFDGLYHVLKTM